MLQSILSPPKKRGKRKSSAPPKATPVPLPDSVYGEPGSVLIDDRAGSKELVKYRPLDIIGRLCRLDSGDVMLSGNGPEGSVLIGVEVKSISDLLSSMATGRLQDTQIPAMLKTYDVSWLLYYGRYETGADNALMVWHDKYKRFYPHSIGPRPVPTGYLEGMLFDLTEIGVNVKHVGTVEECAIWVGCLVRWWSKPWVKHRGLRAFDRSRAITLQPGMDPDTHYIAKIANDIAGLGHKRATAAALHFRSVLEMMTAKEEEWGRIEGIGKVLAASIVQQVRKVRRGK